MGYASCFLRSIYECLLPTQVVMYAVTEKIHTSTRGVVGKASALAELQMSAQYLPRRVA